MRSSVDPVASMTFWRVFFWGADGGERVRHFNADWWAAKRNESANSTLGERVATMP